MTRDMLKNIIQNTFEEQKIQAEAASKKTIKSAYTGGMKRGCEIQGTPLLSLTIGQEHVMVNYLVNHSAIRTPEPIRDVLY